MKYKGWSDPALQRDVLPFVENALWAGVTSKDVERHFDPFTEANHGHISGALSLLHGANKIACLRDRNAERQYVYVGLDYIDSRPCRAQGWNTFTKEERDFLRVLLDHLDHWLEVDEAGSVTGKTTSTRADKFRGIFVAGLKQIWRDRPEPKKRKP